MTDQWVPAPPQPPAPPPPDGLPPANSWSPVTPCAAADSPSIADGVIIIGRPAVVSAMPWQITVNDGGTPANFSIDHYDASGALIEHPIMIDGASGDVTLTHDPTQPLGVATKDYVDTHSAGVTEAPQDGFQYTRGNAAWSRAMPDAPNTSQLYSRFNSVWALDPIQTDAPVDGQAYLRQSGAWALGVTGGPYVPIAGGAMTGPLTMQGSNMIALNAPLVGGGQAAILGQKATVTRWQMMLGDQTTEGAGNAGSNFSLGAFSTTGVMLGTWLTIARADGGAVFNGSGVTIQGGLAVNGTLALAGPGNLAMYGGTNGQFLQTNGSGILSWAAVPPSGVPEAPTDGQLYGRQSSAWHVIPSGGASITVSDTPPPSPTQGALWWNSAVGGGQMYVFYNDGNSSQWVPTTNQMGGGYMPLMGVTDGSDAKPGQIGEVISSVVGLQSGLTSNVAANVTSIALTAGDWDVSGDVYFSGSQITAFYAAINTVSATLPPVPLAGFNVARSQLIMTGASLSSAQTLAMRVCRISLTATTTIYLVCLSVYTTGPVQASGAIWARRAR